MTPTLVLVGALSVYAPNDGHNEGTLACGGKLTWQSTHIALRIWRRVGCGAVAKVCVYGKNRLAMRRVRQRDRTRGVDHMRRVLDGRETESISDGRWATGHQHLAGGDAEGPEARCVWTTVEDSGPWGIQCGRRWRVWTKHRVPRGCRRRAVVDLSWALWRALGSPKFLTKVRVEVYR
jgi:hypothetical protein